MSFFNIGSGDKKYLKNITRFFTIMFDLILIMILLNLLWTSYLQVVGYFYHIPLDVIESYNMGMELSSEEEEIIKNLKAIMLLGLLIQLIFVYGYITFMWCRFATTPGKFLFGGRVVDAETLNKITFKQASIRLCAILLSLLPLGLGIIWSVFDKRSQTWHDKLAKTVVVVKKIDV